MRSASTGASCESSGWPCSVWSMMHAISSMARSSRSSSCWIRLRFASSVGAELLRLLFCHTAGSSMACVAGRRRGASRRAVFFGAMCSVDRL